MKRIDATLNEWKSPATQTKAGKFEAGSQLAGYSNVVVREVPRRAEVPVSLRDRDRERRTGARSNTKEMQNR